ncbi:unnamed protein product [Gadus morhua 'NCC']
MAAASESFIMSVRSSAAGRGLRAVSMPRRASDRERRVPVLLTRSENLQGRVRAAGSGMRLEHVKENECATRSPSRVPDAFRSEESLPSESSGTSVSSETSSVLFGCFRGR